MNDGNEYPPAEDLYCDNAIASTQNALMNLKCARDDYDPWNIAVAIRQLEQALSYARNDAIVRYKRALERL